MSFIKLLDKLSNEEVLNAKTSRKDSFKKMKNFGKGAALASIPFGLAATSNKTKAATMNMAAAAFQASPTDVLNFALTLEYLLNLEKKFFRLINKLQGFLYFAFQNPLLIYFRPYIKGK